MADRPSSSWATILGAAAILVAAPLLAGQAGPAAGGSVSSFYDLKTTTLDGKPGNLAQCRQGQPGGERGQQVRVHAAVQGTRSAQREIKGKGFNVLGFPSNDFGDQEPGTAQEIATFCRLTYDVTFPMFEKVVTRPGEGQSPSTPSSDGRASCPRGTSAST